MLIAAAQEKAQALKLKVNIAVVDDGGHLIAFERMDGARPASGYTAITKATSAATFRQSSGPLPHAGTGPDPLLNLSLQTAASASGGKITSLLGASRWWLTDRLSAPSASAVERASKIPRSLWPASPRCSKR